MRSARLKLALRGAATAVGLAGAPAFAAPADLVITDARIITGTGLKPVVVIKGGAIVVDKRAQLRTVKIL